MIWSVEDSVLLVLVLALAHGVEGHALLFDLALENHESALALVDERQDSVHAIAADPTAKKHACALYLDHNLVPAHIAEKHVERFGLAANWQVPCFPPLFRALFYALLCCRVTCIVAALVGLGLILP